MAYWPTQSASGSHELTVLRSDYQTEVRTVVIPAGETLEVSVSLEAEQLFGSLAIDAFPAGASVYVNEIAHGETPIPGFALPVGEHLLRLTKDGYYDWVRRVEILRDEEFELHIEMQRTEGLFGH